MPETEDRPQNSERKKLLQAASLELEVTELLCELMERKGINRAELARRANVSSAYITKVLRGTTNLTLKTISDLFFALDRSVRVLDRPLSDRGHASLSGRVSPKRTATPAIRRSR
jgi:transcriptional regulator with XRE-family HTH domain